MSELRTVWVMGLVVVMVAGCARPVASSAPLRGTETAAPAGSATTIAAPGPGNHAVESTAARSQTPPHHGRQALLQRACDLGSAVGCNDLGILAWQDADRALPLLERACTLGLARGCANFGVELLRGPRHEQELDHALDLLDGACQQADGYACGELGDALYAAHERIGNAALGKAHGAYEKACGLDYVEACVSDGWLQRGGEGAARNGKKALELFRFACDKQTYSGCAALGFSLVKDANNQADLDEGARWLGTACQHDQWLGCFMLGHLVRQSSSPDAAKHAIELFRRACKLGSANGCDLADALEKQPPAAAAPSPAAAPPAGDDDHD